MLKKWTRFCCAVAVILFSTCLIYGLGSTSGTHDITPPHGHSNFASGIFILTHFNTASTNCRDIIAFTSGPHDGDQNVHLIDMNGQNEHPITDDGISSFPVWSPDGNFIAFQHTVNDLGQVYVIGTDGSSQAIQLTNNLVASVFPTWSPDSKHIGFAGLPSVDSKFQIYTSDRDSSLVQQLVTSPNTYYSAWSPDGTRIAFIAHRGEASHSLYIVSTNGSNSIEIPLDGYPEDYLAWSPDGQYIAYAAGDINVLDVGNLSIRTLTLGRHNSNPHWSPDGTKILFEGFTINLWQIYVINSDGTRETQLTHEGSNGGSSWSPDGERIVFVSDRDANPNIYIMDQDGSNIAQLTRNSLHNTEPAWSPCNTNPG